MTSGPRSRFLACVLLLAGAAAAQAAGDDRVGSFLATLAPPREGPIPFLELRMSALLVEPIEVRGELRLGKDGSIDKHVTSPVEERVRITAGALTLEKGGKSRTVDLAGNARWRAFHAGITGLLNRDAAALERVFGVTLTEAPDGWVLELRPRVSGGKNMVTVIRASGAGPQLRSLRLEQGPSEWQEMTFTGQGN